MRVVIINLTRFGDLLQTQPVIHGLRDAGHQVALVCLENFVSAGKMLDGLSDVFPLPGAQVLSTLEEDWVQSLALLYDFKKSVEKKFSPDLVCNLTSTLGARLLARLFAKDRPICGFFLDEHGFGRNSSLWASFLEACSRKRGCSPYNLADIFRMVADVGNTEPRFRLLQPNAERLNVLSSLLLKESDGVPEGGWIAFQLGASAECRRWPVSHFAALGKLAYEQFGSMPVMLGSKSEVALGEEWEATGTPAVNLIGRTDLLDLASALSHCRLLITNDTGTMHLAAGMGLPILAFFLATAQACDTGPYLEDCCCLEPAMPCHPCGFNIKCPQRVACKDAFTPDLVWPLLEKRLRSGKWPTKVPNQTAAAVRVWVTIRDSHKFFDLSSLSGHHTEERSIWMRMQRHFYRHFFDLAESRTDSAFPPLDATDALLAQSLPKERRAELCTEIDHISALCELLKQQGQVMLKQPSAGFGQRMLSTVHRIPQLLQECDQRGAFDALSRLWTVAIEDLGGNIQAVLRFVSLFDQMIRAWKNALME